MHRDIQPAYRSGATPALATAVVFGWTEYGAPAHTTVTV